MVKIQALKLVPGVNCCEALIARTIVSLTRSSAWSRLRVSDRAKARRCGSTSSSADCNSADIRSNAGSSIPFSSLLFARSASGARLLRLLQLADQLQHFHGYGFGRHVGIEPAKLSIEPAVKHSRGAPILIRTC